MAISLPSLIFRVRSSVSDIPLNMLDDLVVMRELMKAKDYVDKIKQSTATDAQITVPLICLAAYYCHVNYVSIAARKLGDVPDSMYVSQTVSYTHLTLPTKRIV